MSDAEWAIDRHGGEPGIWLVTLWGPEMAALRLARNTEDVVSNGETFAKSWWEVTLPGDTEDQPAAQMSVANINREVGLALMEMTSGLTATFELVRPTDFDTIIKRYAQLQLRLATIDPLSVSGDLSAARHDTEPYIALRFSPRDFPGLHRR